MYYYLTQALKRRLVLELQDSFSKHPVYSKIVPNIQNKYSFKERPQYGIVVKGASANKVALSADNVVGTVMSHVMLANVGEPTNPLEWVREDIRCINANGGRMPTPPGIYYLEVLKAPANSNEPGVFAMDPLVTVTDEPVLRFESGIEQEAQLQQLPVQGTLRLWENSRFLYQEGVHYEVDYSTGAIRLLTRATPGGVLTASYRYATPSIGPVEFFWNIANFSVLSGVVLAFGKRAQEGDKVAIVVYEDRVETATAHGGRFDASFDLDVITRDPNQMEEITDLTWMYLWAQKRESLSSEGIELTDVSLGGETEEVYDETADDFFYNHSVNVQIQADWEIHVPLPLTVSKVAATTPAADRAASPLDTKSPSTIHGGVSSNLFYSTMPTIVGRNNNFERIT